MAYVLWVFMSVWLMLIFGYAIYGTYVSPNFRDRFNDTKEDEYRVEFCSNKKKGDGKMKDVDLQRRIESLLKNGWSYGKLAKELGVSKTTISRWHKGECKPKLLEHYQMIHLWYEGLNCSKEPFVVIQKPEGVKYEFPVTINIETDGLDNAINILEESLAKLKAQKEKDKWQFTKDEKVILRNLPKEYKWIARDNDDWLYVYQSKPEKSSSCDEWHCIDDIGEMIEINEFNHLFKCIQWSDTEPCEFRKFI